MLAEMPLSVDRSSPVEVGVVVYWMISQILSQRLALTCFIKTHDGDVPWGRTQTATTESTQSVAKLGTQSTRTSKQPHS
ncbi:putative FAD-linked oxidoreductase YvdP [Fusarium oxysporum f. sp. albedinis]|nr:putative FAD-linked oxidoreductase YvdP [Fusarium oxysporum f. sp. albedinis]